MASWTLLSIRTLVRKLTGQLSSTNFTDEDVNDIINEFYRTYLPHNIWTKKLDDFYYLLMIAGTGEYDMPVTQDIKDPVWLINGTEETLIPIYTDTASFFALYPSVDTSEGVPAAVCFIGDQIYVRPIPDTGYEIKFSSKVLPSTLLIDDQNLLDNDWGRYIAYGAALLIAGQMGDDELTRNLNPVFQSLKSAINKDTILSNPTPIVQRSF